MSLYETLMARPLYQKVIGVAVIVAIIALVLVMVFKTKKEKYEHPTDGGYYYSIGVSPAMANQFTVQNINKLFGILHLLYTKLPTMYSKQVELFVDPTLSPFNGVLRIYSNESLVKEIRFGKTLDFFFTDLTHRIDALAKELGAQDSASPPTVPDERALIAKYNNELFGNEAAETHRFTENDQRTAALKSWDAKYASQSEANKADIRNMMAAENKALSAGEVAVRGKYTPEIVAAIKKEALLDRVNSSLHTDEDKWQATYNRANQESAALRKHLLVESQSADAEIKHLNAAELSSTGSKTPEDIRAHDAMNIRALEEKAWLNRRAAFYHADKEQTIRYKAEQERNLADPDRANDLYAEKSKKNTLPAVAEDRALLPGMRVEPPSPAPKLAPVRLNLKPAAVPSHIDASLVATDIPPRPAEPERRDKPYVRSRLDTN